MEKLSIIIPAYNEESGISKVISDVQTILNKHDFDFELLVVDDGSTDSTLEIVEGLQNERVKLLRHHYNHGYGAALKTGLRKAKGEEIIIIDADGTYPCGELPNLISKLKDFDMVIGSRVGEKISISSIFRRPVKWAFRKFAGYLVEAKILDLNSGFRGFKKEIALKYFNILPDKFSFTTTITLAFLSGGYEIAYIPVKYSKRLGKSKLKIQDALRFFTLITRTITFFNPLKIFMPISIILFIIGFARLCYEVIVERNIAQSSILLILSSIQVALIGILADMINRKIR